jgi:hypothetical protein
VWRQKLGPGCTYLIRWVIDFWFFSIRLHHWVGSDDQRHMHDHPWWFWTFVFRGGYVERTEHGNIMLRAPTLAFRKAEHKHTVRVTKSGSWSLLLCGPEKRAWGFWVDGRFRKRSKYFFEHGHHQCQ